MPLPRPITATTALILGLLAGGCGTIQHTLPGHSRESRAQPVHLAVGDRTLALATPMRLPAPGGFELTLVSEDDTVVAVERVPGSAGSAKTYLIARRPGHTTLHYANLYAFRHHAATSPEDVVALRASSLGAFPVTVRP